jgi:hypothetical protein
MNTEIGVGLIVGAVAGSSIYIWNSKDFTQSQKTFLLVCILFPPAQWILAILMYFFNKTTKSENFNSSNSSQSRSQRDPIKQKKSSTNEQRQSLEILKDKGVLNETEYQEKIDIINEQIITEEIHKSSEYLNLKNIYENDLLSKQQFEDKTKKLIDDYKEYYSIFGENNYPEFTWELYKSMKVNNKLNVSDYSKSDLYGKWKLKNGQIFLYQEENKDRLKITSWINELNRYGEWELNNSELNVKLYGKFKSDKAVFKISELGSHIFVYFIDDKKFTSIKDTSENKNVW